MPDLIDFFVIKGLSDYYIHVSEDNYLTSDRSPVILTLREILFQRDEPQGLINKWTNWEEFRNELESLITLQVPLKTPQQLEKEVGLFVTSIQQADWHNLPTKTIKYNIHNNIYPLDVKELLSDKRKALKKCQLSRAARLKKIESPE